MGHMFHDPLLDLQIKNDSSTSWVNLNKLSYIVASHCKSFGVSGVVPQCNQDTQNLHTFVNKHSFMKANPKRIPHVFGPKVIIRKLSESNYQRPMRTWKSLSLNLKMFLRQNLGSLCIGDQSRFPENTSALYLSKELNLRILSFKAAFTTSSACDRSCK